MTVPVADVIKAELDVTIHQTIFWSDSSIAHQWITSKSRRFNTFVANRISEIQDSLQVTQWRHVPSSLNPVDICSRGCPVTDLAPDGVWVLGPAFLWRGSDGWPATRVGLTTPPGDEETAETRVTACVTVTQSRP